MKNTKERVQQVLVDELGVAPEQVTAAATIDHDLGADSLDRMELQLALEDAFAIVIPDRDGAQLVTVQDVVDYVERCTEFGAEVA